MVLDKENIDGLLLVGAYREEDAVAISPLTVMLSRWQRQQTRPEQIRLENLPEASVAAMVSEMLRLNSREATELANVIAARTNGNPYDTVELLNALRRDGTLSPGADGWQWDPAALRKLNRTDVAELSAARATAMPGPTRTLLDAMACIGGRVGFRLLQDATGLSAATVEERLTPALDDGLLVMEPGRRETVRFRHDRVHEAILHRLGDDHVRALRLRLARRLGRWPELFAVTAEQYLPVTDAVTDPQERRRVTEVLCRAAEQAQLLSNYTMVERLLASAATLADPADTSLLIEVHTGRHLALCSLGRLDEADDVYGTIDRLCVEPSQRTDATLVQVSSLTHRNRTREAVNLGLELLREFGLSIPPPAQLGSDINERLDELYKWIEETSEADDLDRPDVTDPALLATATLINRMMPAAFFSEKSTMAWLSLEALRMWAAHGPGHTLIGPVSHVPYVAMSVRDDYRVGYRLMRRVLAVGEARGYEPDTSQARFLNALGVAHWFTPLEDSVHETERARMGLIQGGDLQNACYSYYVTVSQLIDCAPTLDDYEAEVDVALAFAGRIGSDQTAETFADDRRLGRVLRAEGGAFTEPDSGLSEADSGSAIAMARKHITRAIEAAVFGDQARLSLHTAAAMPLLPAIVGCYPVAQARLLRGLALAGEARSAPAARRPALLTELDRVIEWMAARAEDGPANYLHLLRLLDAERAWAVGDFRAAAFAFDLAQREAASRQRRWHRALIFEHAARFYLAYGMEAASYPLLAESRREYLEWGATAKVNQLDWAYPTLRSRPDTAKPDSDSSQSSLSRRSTIMVGEIDLLGILAGSRALSSETSIDGLHTRVAEVLSAMTGATDVHLAVWNEDEHAWRLAAAGGGNRGTIPLDEAERQRLVPLAAIRYAERTREPLVVADVMRDDRFSRDPYFLDLDCCSLLVVPIVNRGNLQALLLLENRLIRGAFSAERLDSVMLIAGQLAVSLDNATVYASLERMVAQRTEELAEANHRLQQLSFTDSLTGLANRRQLQQVLRTEWAKAQDAATSIGLAMIDIDHFKRYNDHYGHAAGDRCLRRVAATLSQNIRTVDLAARYGGEEFAIVMPGTGMVGARQLAERLHTAIGDLAEPHALGIERCVTVSVGVTAMIPTDHGDAEQLVETADALLYEAKRNGRDQVRP